MPALRVCSLYPDLMNIYADRGNLLLLERRCAWRGIGFELQASFSQFQFHQVLTILIETPILFLGLSLPEHGYHAPNENFDWQQASGGMVAFAKYFEEVANLAK